MILPLIKSDEVCLIDDDKYDDIKEYKWRLLRQSRKNYTLKYVVSYDYMDGKQITTYLHRLLTDCPTGYLVDHINGDGLDNRMSNLRICDRSQNGLNWHNRQPRKVANPDITAIIKSL